MLLGSKLILLLDQHGLSLLKHVEILIVYYTYEALVDEIIVISK